ncbi:MAG: ADOP family duplicated permease, partial [Bryobacteraceae bacterium]
MRWRRFFRRAQRDEEIARDIQFYLDTETEENLARGMSREQARRAAFKKLGNLSVIREELYHMNSIGVLEDLWHDAHYALRALRKHPAFAAAAVLTLALGIGGNTAMFTVIRAVLLKPLEYPDPDRLVRLSVDKDRPFTPVRLTQMRASAQSFTGIGAFHFSTEEMALSGNGNPEALKGARVSANFLDILGVQPVAGRSFLAEEDTPGGPRVAMISAGVWKRRFGSDPSIAGKTAILNATPYTIVGVLPAGFAFPVPGVDVWVTRPSESSAMPSRFWPFVASLIGFARLKPGVSLEQGQAELNVLNQQYVRANPQRIDAKPGVTLRAVLLKDQLVANVRTMLWMLWGAVGFVLWIACANVASLLLARAASRSREFAIRASLGAARGRLIRQLLAESLLLAVAGGALGVFLANWGLSAITSWSAFPLPSTGEIRLDGVVLGFTIGLSIVTGIVSGILPSLQVSRPHLADALRESGAAAGRGLSGRRGPLGMSMRGVLVMGQIALSMVLLIGAALLMQSLARLRSVDPGFQSSNLLTIKVALPPARYDTQQRKAAFFNELVRRAEAVPGIRGATVAKSLPTTLTVNTNIEIQGQPQEEVDPRKWPQSQLQSITPGYFRTLGIPVRRGREFTARDNIAGAPPVVIINESFARRFWPAYPRGQDPIGGHMREGMDRTGWLQIVGIVADVRQGGLAANAWPQFYVLPVVHAPQTAYLAARTDGGPLLFVNTIRKQVLAIDRD